MKTKNEIANEILNSDRLCYFVRWISEIWAPADGLDAVVRMLEKPYNYAAEWNEYIWLCERFDTVAPECTKDDMDECSADFSE